jgi:hypothetical protein
MYWFRSLRAISCLGPHSTFAEPLNMLKMGRLLSASFAMNLLRSSIRPVNFCTPFFGLRGLHLEDGLDFIEASFDAFGGDQTTKYFALCYSEDTLVWVQFELGFAHIGESSCQAE